MPQAEWELPAGREGRLRLRASSTGCHTVAGEARERQASAVQLRRWVQSWQLCRSAWAKGCWTRPCLALACLVPIARARLGSSQHRAEQMWRVGILTTPRGIITEIHYGVLVVVQAFGLSG